MMKESELFKALADDTRLRVLNLLLSTDTGLCVCEVADALKLPQYQVSRHMHILRIAGLVCADRQGTWAYYALHTGQRENAKLFAYLREFLTNEPFKSDRASLGLRLSLRVGGKCVVGFAPRESSRSSTLNLQAKKSAFNQNSYKERI